MATSSEMANFARRRQMAARTKQAISRALKGKKRRPGAGAIARGVGGAILGRTRAGTRARMAALAGGGLAVAGTAAMYRARALNRSLYTPEEAEKVVGLTQKVREDFETTRNSDTIKEAKEKIRSFRKKKAADKSDVNLDRVVGKYKAKIKSEMADHRVRTGEARSELKAISNRRKERSKIKNIIRDDINQILGRKKVNYRAPLPPLAEFRRQQSASTKRKISEALKRKLRSRSRREADDRKVRLEKQGHNTSKATLVGGAAGAIAGSKLVDGLLASGSLQPDRKQQIADGYDGLQRARGNALGQSILRATGTIAGGLAGGMTARSGASLINGLSNRKRRRTK